MYQNADCGHTARECPNLTAKLMVQGFSRLGAVCVALIQDGYNSYNGYDALEHDEAGGQRSTRHPVRCLPCVLQD